LLTRFLAVPKPTFLPADIKALAKEVAQELIPLMDAKVEAARRCISPEAEARCSHAACVLTNGKTLAAKHIGVAIAISSTQAVTAYHVVAPLLASKQRVVFGFTERKERIKFHISRHQTTTRRWTCAYWPFSKTVAPVPHSWS
jgi:hypothetical protein